MLTLLSYNILFGKKIDQILKWFDNRKLPDIICLQEFPIKSLDDFQRLFGAYEYDCCFTSATINKKGIYGELTAFNTNKLQLISNETINLGESKLEKVVYRHMARKTALLTKFDKLTVINVHLGTLVSNKKRLDQLETVVTHLPNHQKPSVIVGDYNYSNLTGLTRLVKFMRKFGFEREKNSKRTHHFISLLPQQIDHLFYKDLTVKKLEVLNIKLSDHYPLLASLLV